MSKNLTRRGFLKDSAIATAATILSLEERALLAKPAGETPGKSAQVKAGSLPTGKIGNLTISRVLCGGNLFSSFAHSRDLVYVSTLLKHYFTDEKVWETLALCESNGINTALMRVDEQILRIIKGYRQRGGKIQWIAQCKPTDKDLVGDIETAVDAGAVGVYLHGGVADTWAKDNKMELVGKFLEIGRQHKVPSGVGGHEIATTTACEKAGLQPDFYMKTLHSKNYWSAGPAEERDNIWEKTPDETIAFMRNVPRPWIAYKVLAAGAIRPNEGFRYAFENGADFVCVGMFDFQVAEDVGIAQRLLAGLKDRQRPWRA